MNEIKLSLLGSQSCAAFAALVFFALIGLALSGLLQTTKRNVTSAATPVQFSWKFFLRDNWRRWLTAALLIYVALRFTPELFGMQISTFWALAIGFSLDKVAQFIKDKTGLLGQKKDV